MSEALAMHTHKDMLSRRFRMLTVSQLNFTPLESTGGQAEIIATINASGEALYISAAKLNITGATVFSSGDTLTEAINSGVTTIDGDSITAGTIEADRMDVATLSAITADIGTITAGSISGVTLAIGAGNDIFKVDADGNTSWGHANIDSSVAKVLKTGAATFTNLTVTGGAITADVITSGSMSAARISGGTIGACTISADNITTGTMSAARITAGTMSAARISGGTIGACTISAGNITTGTMSANRISGGTIVATISITSPIITGTGSITATTFTGGTFSGSTVVGSLWCSGGVVKVTGTGGTGFVDMRQQSSNPGTATSNYVRMYFDGNENLKFIRDDGDIAYINLTLGTISTWA